MVHKIDGRAQRAGSSESLPFGGVSDSLGVLHVCAQSPPRERALYALDGAVSLCHVPDVQPLSDKALKIIKELGNNEFLVTLIERLVNRDH